MKKISLLILLSVLSARYVIGQHLFTIRELVKITEVANRQTLDDLMAGKNFVFHGVTTTNAGDTSFVYEEREAATGRLTLMPMKGVTGHAVLYSTTAAGFLPHLDKQIEMEGFIQSTTPEANGRRYLKLTEDKEWILTIRTQQALTIVSLYAFPARISTAPAGGSQQREERRAAPNTSVSAYPKQRKRYPLFTVSAGFRGAQLRGDWTKEPFGFERALGGDLSVAYRVKPGLSLVVNAGLLQSKVKKNYATSGVHQYYSMEEFRQVPLQVGLRGYLGPVYLQPLVGVNLLQVSFEAPDSEVYSGLSYKATGAKACYGLSLGVEFRVGKLQADISGQFNGILNDGFYGYSGSIPAVGLRLGLGIGFLKR